MRLSVEITWLRSTIKGANDTLFDVLSHALYTHRFVNTSTIVNLEFTIGQESRSLSGTPVEIVPRVGGIGEYSLLIIHDSDDLYEVPFSAINKITYNVSI